MLLIVAAQMILCGIVAGCNALWLSSSDFDNYVLEMKPEENW